MNNGNSSNPKKDEAKRELLNFLEEPKSSPRWSHSGVYTSYTFGENEKKVKFILLDNRYNLSKKGGILGATQRTWLEQELKEPNLYVLDRRMVRLPSV